MARKWHKLVGSSQRRLSETFSAPQQRSSRHYALPPPLSCAPNLRLSSDTVKTAIKRPRAPKLRAVRFYGVVDDRLGEAVELFLDRDEAERVVEDWDRDEPGQADLLRVEVVELDVSSD